MNHELPRAKPGSARMPRTSIRIIWLQILCLCIFNTPVFSESLPQGHNPKVCTAVFQDAHGNTNWGRHGGSACQNHSAITLLSIPDASRYAESKDIPLMGICCTLPADDILLEDHLDVIDRCPEDRIVTSSTSESTEGHTMRCTKINTKRYSLTKEAPGTYWGFNSTFWKNTSRIMKSDIPEALYHAAGRNDRYSWVKNGCLGMPFGSLLVSKSSKRCQGLGFRQLIFNGIEGDPPRGTPVKMFPDCVKVSGVFDAEGVCEN